MKFFILNHCSHNKGDNSVLYYLIGCIKSADPTSQISMSSSDGKKPFWYEEEMSTTYWPGGKLFRAETDGFIKSAIKKANSLMMRHIFYRTFILLYSNKFDHTGKFFSRIFGKDFISQIVNCDKVICTGGHHISNVLEKNCINSQLISLAIAQLFGKHITLWSQSIGPFNGASTLTLKSISRIFDNCDAIFVRDELSIRCVKSISKSIPQIAPDSVFLAAKKTLDSQNGNGKNIICAIYTAGITNEKYLEKYVTAWRNISERLVASGYGVVFIPMQYKNLSGDEREFLMKIVEGFPEGVSYIDNDVSPKDTINIFNQSAAIIGHKTHSVIYGLALSKPTIAIAYHEKTRQFMFDFGLKDFVFDEIIGQETSIVEATLASIKSPPSKINREQSMNAALSLDKNMKNIIAHRKISSINK